MDTAVNRKPKLQRKNIPVVLLLEYLFGIGPPMALPWLIGLKLIPCWVASSYIAGLVICAVTWEIFVTFGIAGGLSFTQREPNDDNPFLASVSMNWVLMSSLDCGLVLHILMMGSALFFVEPYDTSIFTEWRRDVLFIFYVVGYGQGVLVALFHRYKDINTQRPLLQGKNLSWMPLSPWLPLEKDPVLNYGILKYLTFRIMWPWVFMPVIWNAVLIYGVYELPIPHPLFTFTALAAAICLYMVFFTPYFPVQPGVPSIIVDVNNPAQAWKPIIGAIVKGTAVLVGAMLLSSGLAYARGVLPCECETPVSM